MSEEDLDELLTYWGEFRAPSNERAAVNIINDLRDRLRQMAEPRFQSKVVLPHRFIEWEAE